MADRIEQQFGLYRLIRLIGRGGFAEVYLGEHVRMLTQAVVKVFQLQLTHDEEERFGEEARAVSRLGHPHIMPLLDFGVQDGTPFLVMDYAPNGTLRDQFPRGTPQAPGTILPYIWQVADALHFVHGQHAMHRNLKPENILLDAHNEALLSDFALPVIFQSPRYQAALERTGTAAYLAPEQIRGQTIPASDQYALATLIYEWLYSAPLFQGSITEVMAKHLFSEPTPLRERVRTISPAIDVVLMGALSKDPADRFPSVESFARAFEEASQAVPVLLFMPPALVDAPELDEPGVTEAASAPPAAPGAFEPEPEPPPQPGASSEMSEAPAVPLVITAPMAMPPFAPPPDSQPDSAATPMSPSEAQPIITPPPSRPSVEQPIITPPPSRRPTQPPIITPQPAAPLVITLPPASPVAEQPVAASAPPALPATPPFPPILVSAPGGAWSSTRPESPTAMPTPSFTVPGRPRPTSAPLGSLPPLSPQPMSAQPLPVQPTPTSSAPVQPQPSQTALGATWREVDWIPTAPPPAAVSAFPPPQPPRAGLSRRSMLVGGMVGLLGVAGALTWLGVSKLSNHPAASNPGVRPTTRPSPTPTATPAPKPGDTMFTYHGHTGFLRGVSWSPDGKRIASASDDGTVQIWDAFTGAQPLTYHSHTDAVKAVAWSKDGTLIASGSQDRTVRIWNPTTGQTLHDYTFGAPVVAVAWSLDGAFLAAASLDFTIGVWDTKTWIRLHRLGAFGAVHAVSWSPDSIHLVSGDANRQAIIWNIDTGGRIRTYRGQASTILALAWSPDGTGIASGADLPDMTLQYWNSLSLDQLWSIDTQGATPSLAWSPNGAQLAAGGNGVSLLNPTSGAQLLGYQGDAAALAWSPDGTYIASGGQSTTVQVWRTK
jgi:serine/threonine protein kinase